MNICVFGTRGFPGIQGGVEKHSECLYTSMPSDLSFTIFRRKPFVEKTRDKHLSESIKFVDLPSTKIKGFEAFFHSFLSALCCVIQRPDLVHVHNIGPGMFIPLLKLFRIKTVLTYHSANYEHAKWGRSAKILLRMSEAIALWGADAVVFVNKGQLNKYKDSIKRKSIYIPNGVVFKAKSEGFDYLKKHNLESGTYILAVGRITQEKGFDYLIQAFSSITQSGHKLVIVGGVDHETPFSAMLLEEAQRNDVVMTGFIQGEELSQIYSHAGLFVLPSYNEGFPIVALEAMSYGLDILLSDIPANKELNLDESFYFRTGDKADLRQKIEKKITRVTNTVKYDLAPYNWGNIAKTTSEIYFRI